MRKAAVKRKTKETEVEVEVDLDGTGRSSVATGIGFLDHMLDLLARHSRIDITVKALGFDRDVDARVARQQVEHVIEEADAGRHRRAAGPVEIDLDLDLGFLGLALHGRFAHFEPLAVSFTRAPFIRGLPDSPPRTA